MAPLLSVLFITNRGNHCISTPGVTVYGLLSESLRAQVCQEYELIVVDERNELPRRELAWLEGRVRYLRPRATPWRRLGAFAPNSARNTGLVYVQAPTVVGLDDCFGFGSGYLARVAELAARGQYAAAVLSQADASVAYPPQPVGIVPLETPLGGLCCYPLQAAVALNGWDEKFDGGSGGDIDFTARLRRHGVVLVRTAEVKVVGYDHRGRHTSHPRCWWLAWDLAERRRERTLAANEPWTGEELEAWRTCGRGERCRLRGCPCDAGPESAEAAALRVTYESAPWFDLATARASIDHES